MGRRMPDARAGCGHCLPVSSAPTLLPPSRGRDGEMLVACARSSRTWLKASLQVHSTSFLHGREKAHMLAERVPTMRLQEAH